MKSKIYIQDIPLDKFFQLIKRFKITNGNRLVVYISLLMQNHLSDMLEKFIADSFYKKVLYVFYHKSHSYFFTILMHSIDVFSLKCSYLLMSFLFNGSQF